MVNGKGTRVIISFESVEHNGKHDFKIGNIFKFTLAIEETLTMF